MRRIRRWLQRLDALTQPGDASEGESIITLSGVSLRLWRMYGMFWLVCLGYAALLVLQTHLTSARVLLVAVCAALFVGLYAWLIWPHPAARLALTRAQFHRTLLPFIALTTLVLLLSFADGPAWLWLFVCVSAVAGLIFPLALAAAVVTGLTLLSLVLETVRVGWTQAIPLALLVRGLGLDMIGLILLVGALRQVQIQRRAVAQLAVTEERLRVARDLHDVLGHTLSTITLKSALAQRLAASDPARAADEMREVERVARATLREVRATIAGYRLPALRSELEAARQILAAASIDATIEDAAGSVPPAVDGTLAWVVREGVTNVLRHSRAKACLITLARDDGAVRLAMTNDGCRCEESASGTGIAGLAERVKSLGGQLSAGPALLDGRPGFLLRVELPLPPREPDGQEA